MYLHLGQNVVVPEATVIGIFDLDKSTSSFITRKFLSDAEKTGSLVNVSDELPNSFVVCDEGVSHRRMAQEESPRRFAPPPFNKGGKKENDTEMKIYLSQLSSQTLFKRSETKRFE